ncbi:ATP-binding protein [Mycoplasmopsis citelli]|uniref:AAA ATPase-domain-containing protein n=1 Tax=Mycoplasmopsis citelli TaxID=171281 RepID=A0A449B338_9BACT|nr:ATP-binding protein [Mycoplasmopsis citelli]UUD36405.1 ATP-binding protein [Mycoplasmopsis citelli]VEU75010.1 AAA ATPase-domain-containing protein [Mycoplasmopsis citelli]
MKKANVINLIKYYSEKNDWAFRNEAYQIASEFDKIGDYQLAEYVMSLLSGQNTFVPQINEKYSSFVKKVSVNTDPLPIPDAINNDILGIINVAAKQIAINKFLFQGPPGTGKTESAKQIARILKRDLFIVDFTTLIDSKLGQTGKNIAQLFYEINSLNAPEKAVILFDEIDALALDRTHSDDHREMGRATTTVLNGLDNLNEKIVLIATTNLYKHFEKALIRRFDYVIDFSRYTREDLIEISEIILNSYLSKFKTANRNMRLFKKIISLMKDIPLPGELKNLIKTSLAFSSPSDGDDYFRRIYKIACNEDINDLKTLQKQGFTLREIEILTGVSKSKASRDLKE